MTAKPKQTVVTNAGTDTLRAGFIKTNENFDELFEKFSTLEAYHTPAVTGAFVTGAATDSGNPIVVTGTGYLTTTTNAAGFISDASGNNNSYIYIDSGAAVRRVVQYFSGPAGLIAINLAGSADNMIHAEFTSGVGVNITVWTTPGGSSPAFKSITKNAAPVINDATPHELMLEVYGDFASAYVDGVLCTVIYDSRISAVVGNFCYLQIQSTTDRIYGWETYLDDAQQHLDPGVVDCGLVQTQALWTGNQRAAGFAPAALDSVYHYLDSSFFRIEGATSPVLRVEAGGPGGSGTMLVLQNDFDHQLVLNCETNATGSLSFQGTKYISIANSGRLSFPYPLSASTVADATDATTVIARLNELLAVCRAVGIITT